MNVEHEKSILCVANTPAVEKEWRSRIESEQKLEVCQLRQRRHADMIKRKINFAKTVFALAVGSTVVLAIVYLAMSMICRSMVV